MATKNATDKQTAPMTKAAKPVKAAKAGDDPAGSAAAVKAISDNIRAATAQPVAEKAITPRREVKALAETVAPSGKAKAAKPASKQAPTKKDGAEKKKKIKLVRDSFAIPEAEYIVIADLKRRCVEQGLAVKKSEVLRAAIAHLAALSDGAVSEALAKVVPIKTGRPPKHVK